MIKIIEQPQIIDTTVSRFLSALVEPTCIHVKGKDSSRCRFAVTLLHGNEPSGITAFHQFLVEKQVPAVDLYLVIMNVKAALEEPIFSHRQLPGLRDLNRCFKAPYDDDEGRLANALLALIHDRQPEALLDIHNTSGTGPAFGVAIHLDSKHDALISLFTERLIITDLRLGALMELSEQDVPTVTVECGGSAEPKSHAIAYEGLMRYANKDDLFDTSAVPWPIEILHSPIRLELDPDTQLDYAISAKHDQNTELTLIADIEHHNFGQVTPDNLLGWIDEKHAHRLKIKNAKGYEPLGDWFSIENGELRPARPLKLFMITGRKDIALSDCLLYAVRCR